MYIKQVKIILDKLNTFTINNVDTQLFVSNQKKTQGLLKKNIFKIVISEKFLSNI